MIVLDTLLMRDFLEHRGDQDQPAAAADVCPYAAVFLILAGAAERFTFQLFRAVFVPFLIGALHFSTPVAGGVFRFFYTLYALSPIFGSLLADCVLGRQWTINGGFFVFIAGHMLLLIGSLVPEFPAQIIFVAVGAFIICISAGGIRSSLSCFICDQFRPQMQNAKRKFSHFIFVVGIFVGLAAKITGSLFFPYGLNDADYGFAQIFIFTTVVAMIGCLSFNMGSMVYHVSEFDFVRARRIVGCLGTIVYQSAIGFFCHRPLNPVQIAARRYNAGVIHSDGQEATTWAAQVAQMNSTIAVGDIFVISASETIVFRPIFVAIFAPILIYIVYPCFKNQRCQIEPYGRMIAGAVFMCGSFFAAAVVQSVAEERSDGSVPLYAVIAQYALLAAGELLFMLGGSEYATSFSSVDTKPMVHSLWLLTETIGNGSAFVFDFCADLLFGLSIKLWILAGLMIVVTIIFIIVTCFSARRPPPKVEATDNDQNRDIEFAADIQKRWDGKNPAALPPLPAHVPLGETNAVLRKSTMSRRSAAVSQQGSAREAEVQVSLPKSSTYTSSDVI